MSGAKVDFLRLSRRRPVAGTVVGGTEIGATLDHLAWCLAGHHRHLEEARARGIVLGLTRMSLAVPVARPFPGIADHVLEPIAVRVEAANRRQALIAVVVGIDDRKDALPGVCPGFAVRLQLASPGILLAIEAAA